MDLRQSLNAVSDVIVNRPHPLREFDQIYMKAADMLIQADHVSKWLDGRNVVFIGDGDALSLCLIHLQAQQQLQVGPEHVHILDFDERLVNSVLRFAERYEYADRISATLYNVADSLPGEEIGKYDAFYTNPPFGGSNDGSSVLAFLRRGIEASKADSTCCAVMADDMKRPWCRDVLGKAQEYLLSHGYYTAELVPAMHSYHLYDDPDLTSCSLIALRNRVIDDQKAISEPLDVDSKKNFYGRGAALKIRYVRDITNGGKFASRDHKMESYPED